MVNGKCSGIEYRTDNVTELSAIPTKKYKSASRQSSVTDNTLDK